MPRVPDGYAECVVYLYPSKAAAEAGDRIGGTGFAVSVKGNADPATDFLYIVTNRHVIEAGNTTVRINTTDGKHDSVEYDERNWILGPKNLDLAIYPVPELDEDKFSIRVAEVSDFITRQEVADLDIGIGNDVFYIGRFVNAEGKERNMPTLRFGTIAQIPIEPIDGKVSFLIEARSIPGFSGSPVFVYILKSEDPFKIKADKRYLPNMAFGPKILGVDWGHIYDFSDAYDDKGNKLPFQIRSNSGLMAVVPIWYLQVLLDDPKVKQMRTDREREIIQKRVANSDAAKPSKASPAIDANPTHREDFMRLVGAAAKKPAQED